MNELLEEAEREFPRAFESEDYERRRSAVFGDVAMRRDALQRAFDEMIAQPGPWPTAVDPSGDNGAGD